jgi:hypothetical protein
MGAVGLQMIYFGSRVMFLMFLMFLMFVNEEMVRC